MSTPPEPLIRQRIIEANHFAKEGMPAESLALILECVDRLAQLGSGADGASFQVAFVALVSLAKSYPPARQAMVERNVQLRLLSQLPAGSSIDLPRQAAPEVIDASQRYQRAAQMIMRGEQPETALQELWWCFDAGMRHAPPLRGVRRSFVLGSIAKLGATYPPACASLRERLDQIGRRWQNDPEEWQDLVAIARVLKNHQAVLDFYDRLKRAGAALPDPRWIVDQLIEARRYAEAVAAVPVETHRQIFERYLAHIAQRPERPFAIQVRYLAIISGIQLEALAGCGELSTAASVVIRMLEVDRSDATLKLLRQHADRCGHPELVPAD